MKIAIVVRNLTRAGGGLEHYALLLVRGLARRGHEVHLFARAWDALGEAGEPPVQCHRVAAAPKPAWLGALMFHWNVSRQLARSDFDIVLGSGLVLFAPQHLYRLSGGVMAEWLRLRYPSPLLRWLALLVRPVLLVNWWLERRLLAGGVSYVIANSRRYHDAALRRYGIPPDRIGVIYNGYDPARFNPTRAATLRRQARRTHGLPDDAVVLGFVAHNFRLKGLDLLLRQFPAVLRRSPKIWLVVVGKGRPWPFQRLARRLGIDRRVIFAGASEQVEDYYALTDILVLPTRYDPFANVCLEAMACGLPVVTSRINGASELIRDGINGYVIGDPADGTMLADRIGRLLDPGHRASLGQAAARTAADYTVDRHLDRIEQLCVAVRASEAPAKALRASLRAAGPDVTVNADYQALLEHHGLQSFETLMGYAEGVPVKDRGGKRVFQIRLESEGRPVMLFLKRHRLPLSGWQRALRWIGKTPCTEGAKEWAHILAFHDRRLPTVEPIAVGGRVTGAVQESFLLTRGLQEYESLERIAPKRFSPPLTAELVREKRRLIHAIGVLTRQMHWSGFYHRDYYWAHLMMRRESPSPAQELRLIDLQRVIRFPWLRRRWQIKDLASINYSVRELGLTRADRVRFLRAYDASAVRDAAFQDAIIRKTDRIARHARGRATR
jgi:UDP-glucose:(heptosyl)LPS alpha-1,3-glucosyltransferase